MHQTDTVERALQLARGGSCRTLHDVRQALKAEGFGQIDSHLNGPSLRKQLKDAMKMLD